MEESSDCSRHGCDSQEFEEIASRISDLDKWREIFSSHGLELIDGVAQRHQEGRKSEEEAEDTAGRPPSTGSKPCRSGSSFTVPYSIPQALTVSPSLGGQPVTLEMALNLRKFLFGSTLHVFNYEWKKSYFKFREPHSDLSYAVEAERGGARAVQMVVQANIIKHLLFTRNQGAENGTLQSLYDVSEKEQEKALAVALTDALWAAGEGVGATVCLVTSDCYFTPSVDYKVDNFTERMQLFSFNEKEATWTFIYEHIQCFKEEGSHGVILFLYSLIFSRTPDRLRDDLDFTTPHLLQLSLGNFVCRQALLNLMLTGRASPNMFNGDVQYDGQGCLLPQPLRGVLARSDVGYLHWDREQQDQDKLPTVGSMLKTPKLPIWLCCINGTYSVLFSTNRSLLSDWKVEHLFDLCFYNGQPSQKNTVLLTIEAEIADSIQPTSLVLVTIVDTHSHHWEEERGVAKTAVDPEKRFPSVEMTIRTKWEGAAIDWNGTVPFF